MKDNKGYTILDMAPSSHSVPVMEVWCWSKEHLWKWESDGEEVIMQCSDAAHN